MTVERSIITHTVPCMQVTGVLVQGRGDGEEWVTAFLISYSLDAFTWKYAGDTYGNKRVILNTKKVFFFHCELRVRLVHNIQGQNV